MHAHRRLVLCCVVSAALLLAVIFGVRIPPRPGPTGVDELVVRIVTESNAPAVEPQREDPLPAVADQPASEVTDRPAPEIADAEPSVEPLQDGTGEGVAADWYAAADAVIEASGGQRTTLPFGDGFAARMAVARERGLPTRPAEAKPIWENTETDAMGRTLLVHGDCHRVINDPNVGSRDAFLVFHQYLVFCSSQDPGAKELDWVRDLEARYAYLPGS